MNSAKKIAFFVSLLSFGGAVNAAYEFEQVL